MKIFVRLLLIMMLGVMPVMFSGCGNKVKRMDQNEENHPAMKKARIRRNAQDIQGAVKIYNDLIAREPNMARAHLEIALLYDNYLEDYVRAIYHYQRYVEMRPTTEKQEMVDDLIRMARIHYAASLPDTPSGAVEEIASLKQQNEVLKNRIIALMETLHDAGMSENADPAKRTDRANVRDKIALNSVQSGDTTTVKPVATPKPEQAKPAMGSYTVKPGDTLSKISGRVYSNPGRWREIYKANKQTMKSSSDLTPGQTLMIPR